MTPPPTQIHLERDSGLTLHWADGVQHFIPVAVLRRMSPSAEAKQLRHELATNPLAIIPNATASDQPLRAENLEMVGNYAIRIQFSDGHSTGLYTWSYLYSLGESLNSDR